MEKMLNAQCSSTNSRRQRLLFFSSGFASFWRTWPPASHSQRVPAGPSPSFQAGFPSVPDRTPPAVLNCLAAGLVHLLSLPEMCPYLEAPHPIPRTRHPPLVHAADLTPWGELHDVVRTGRVQQHKVEPGEEIAERALVAQVDDAAQQKEWEPWSACGGNAPEPRGFVGCRRRHTTRETSCSPSKAGSQQNYS